MEHEHDPIREEQYRAWMTKTGMVPDTDKQYNDDEDGLQEKVDDLTYAAWLSAIKASNPDWAKVISCPECNEKYLDWWDIVVGVSAHMKKAGSEAESRISEYVRSAWVTAWTEYGNLAK